MKKYTKAGTDEVFEVIGVHRSTTIKQSGIKLIIIYGRRRPHLVFVLSEIIPHIGSFRAFQMLHMINAIVIQSEGKPIIE